MKQIHSLKAKKKETVNLTASLTAFLKHESRRLDELRQEKCHHSKQFPYQSDGPQHKFWLCFDKTQPAHNILPDIMLVFLPKYMTSTWILNDNIVQR